MDRMVYSVGLVRDTSKEEEEEEGFVLDVASLILSASAFLTLRTHSDTQT